MKIYTKWEIKNGEVGLSPQCISCIQQGGQYMGMIVTKSY